MSVNLISKHGKIEKDVIMIAKIKKLFAYIFLLAVIISIIYNFWNTTKSLILTITFIFINFVSLILCSKRLWLNFVKVKKKTFLRIELFIFILTLFFWYVLLYKYLTFENRTSFILVSFVALILYLVIREKE